MAMQGGGRTMQGERGDAGRGQGAVGVVEAAKVAPFRVQPEVYLGPVSLQDFCWLRRPCLRMNVGRGDRLTGT